MTSYFLFIRRSFMRVGVTQNQLIGRYYNDKKIYNCNILWRQSKGKCSSETWNQNSKGDVEINEFAEKKMMRFLWNIYCNVYFQNFILSFQFYSMLLIYSSTYVFLIFLFSLNSIFFSCPTPLLCLTTNLFFVVFSFISFIS